MREILFRGKTEAGEWVYGGIAFQEDGAVAIVGALDKYYSLYDLGIDLAYVIPETVGQYTGLTDKNGKRIFAGDIVRYGDTVHEVVFEQRSGTAYFGLVYNSFETLPFGHYQDLKQIEVIGNIHDNPELMEVR